MVEKKTEHVCQLKLGALQFVFRNIYEIIEHKKGTHHERESIISQISELAPRRFQSICRNVCLSVCAIANF